MEPRQTRLLVCVRPVAFAGIWEMGKQQVQLLTSQSRPSAGSEFETSRDPHVMLQTFAFVSLVHPPVTMETLRE